MARGVADVLEVVVLAAGAHAALRRGGAHVRPLVQAEKDVLELHHAGVGEQQRRVVGRHQRAGRHDGVAVALEVLQKARANLTALHLLPCLEPQPVTHEPPRHAGHGGDPKTIKDMMLQELPAKHRSRLSHSCPSIWRCRRSPCRSISSVAPRRSVVRLDLLFRVGAQHLPNHLGGETAPGEEAGLLGLLPAGRPEGRPKRLRHTARALSSSWASSACAARPSASRSMPFCRRRSSTRRPP